CRPFRTQRRRESRLQQQYPGQTSNVLKIPIMQDGTGRYNRAEMPPPNIVICLACQPPFFLQLEALRENLAFDRKFQFAIFLNERHRFASVSPVKLEGSPLVGDRKSTRLNSSHVKISYAVFCLKKKKKDK